MSKPIDPPSPIGYTGDAVGAPKDQPDFIRRVRKQLEPATSYNLRDINSDEAQQFLDLKLMHEANHWDGLFHTDGLKGLKAALKKAQNGNANELELAILSQAETVVNGYKQETYGPGRPATPVALYEQIAQFHALGLQLKPTPPSKTYG